MRTKIICSQLQTLTHTARAPVRANPPHVKISGMQLEICWFLTQFDNDWDFFSSKELLQIFISRNILCATKHSRWQLQFFSVIRSITTQSKEGASMRKCARREARAKQRFQGQTWKTYKSSRIGVSCYSLFLIMNYEDLKLILHTF